MKKKAKDVQVDASKVIKLTARAVFDEENPIVPDINTKETIVKGGKIVTYSTMSFDDFDMQEAKIVKSDRFQDKIFDNTYNTGSTDTQRLPDIKVNNEYASSRLDDCYDSEQYAVKSELLNSVYNIYMDSQWKSMSRDKKCPKELAPFIFNDLWHGLGDNHHSATDKFIAIAEFMDMSYEKVYDAAGLSVKEQIISELNIKYNILGKKNINRLF